MSYSFSMHFAVTVSSICIKYPPSFTALQPVPQQQLCKLNFSKQNPRINHPENPISIILSCGDDSRIGNSACFFYLPFGNVQLSIYISHSGAHHVCAAATLTVSSYFYFYIPLLSKIEVWKSITALVFINSFFFAMK